jgi:hypothetical protein
MVPNEAKGSFVRIEGTRKTSDADGVARPSSRGIA